MRLVILLFVVFLSIIQAKKIKKIEYEGLFRISTIVADDTLGFKVGDEIDYSKIDKSIKKFYSFGYFDDISVFDENSTIIYKFVEKPSIAKIDVNGYKARKEDLDLLFGVMGIKKGSMFTEQKVEYAKKQLLKSLEMEGYINSVVEVTIEHINKDSVHITFDVNKGDEILIKKVNYFGAKNLDKDDFELITANKEEDFFWWWFGQNYGDLKLEDLKYDHLRINELYLQKGFLDVKVKEPFMSIDFLSNRATLDFFIEEGVKYKVGDIKVDVNNTIIDPLTLYPDMKLYKGITFNIKKLRKDLALIKTKIADQGYAYADVRYNIKRDKKAKIADVQYKVIPGKKVYINDIVISGNTRTLDRVIRRDIYLAPGDLYSESDFKDSKNNLRRTGFFESVEIKRHKLTDTLIDIVVNVKETATGSLILGGGYGSYDGWMLNASVSDKNIFGSGLALKFSLDYSKKKDNYTLSLSNPAINDSIYSGSIAIHRDSSDIDYTNYSLNTLKKGATIGVGRSLTRHSRIGTSYTYDTVEESYSNDHSLDNDYVLSSITPYIRYNNTDDYYVPRNGFLAGLSAERAGIGGDAKFLRSSAYFKTFYSLDDWLDKDWIIRYKAKVKVLKDLGNLKASNSFYLGGPSSLRGYKSYAFGPGGDDDEPYKKFFTNSIELSFPLIPSSRMRWALFYDYGMIGQDKFDKIKRAGRGAVIEWFSPVGPLQFIFSRAVNPKDGDRTSNFEFNLGGVF